MEVLGAAYVLHRRAYQNSGEIVHLLTEALGRVDVVAKGSKPKSGKSRFNLQFFQLIDIHCKGKTDLLSLYAAESLGQSAVLEGKTLFCALYVNELLKELLPKHDAVPDIFQLYQQTQQALRSAKGSLALEVLLREFEIKLLDALGYGIHFVDIKTGEALQEKACYRYQQEQGFIHADRSQAGVFDGQALNSISAFDFSNEQTRKQAKHLLRSVISYHLGGKALKSRELFI